MDAADRRNIMHLLYIYYFAQVDSFKTRATTWENLAIPDGHG